MGIDDDADQGLFMSRNGSSSPFGKLTEDLKLRISFTTAVGLKEKAAALNLGVAEYVRTMLDCDVHGIEKVASIAADRVRQVAGKGE